VNAALVKAFLRQRLSSPLRLMLILLVMAPGILMSAFTRSLGSLGDSGVWFAFILAAGAIGQDVSSGVLQLTFARPVSRPSYVFSRWLAAGGFGAALALAQIAIAAALVLARDGRPELGDTLTLILGNVLASLTMAAVIVMLSSLVNGLGDVALWFLTFVSLQMGTALATAKNWTGVQRVIGETMGLIHPQLHLGWLVGRGEPSWFELVSLFSTLALALAIAVRAVNAKELSYATG
jgi:ABC-type transport system involved in multi-copper enzyme maturation permease subunit